ncbi:MAG: FecR domain-containing protein, partial [Actinomycetia bacterium]|nr:FecR domain-containing protein [Actinomycetes bacterium]
MLKKQIFVVALIILLLFSCSKDGSKTQEITPANITFIMGDIQFKTVDGSWEAAEMGTGISKGDMVKSGAGSFCDIQVGDASVFRVKENTEIAMKNLYYDHATGQENSRIKISVGKLLVKPKKLLKTSSFEVETPSAVCGVRGTKFMIEASEDSTTKIVVSEGKVKVRKRIAAIDDKPIEEQSAEELK